MYKVYVNNQELHSPFVVIEEDGHRYILSNLIDVKNILWDLLMQTPAGQDISRDLVIAELVAKGIFSSCPTASQSIIEHTSSMSLKEGPGQYFV